MMSDTPKAPFTLDQVLEGAGSAVISGHIRPDGDCVGACLGLAGFIRRFYPSVRCDVRLEPFSHTFRFLKGAREIIHTPGEETYDVFFCLDCAGDDRLGDNASFRKSAKKTVCIDHHRSSTAFGDACWIVPDASSASELVARLIGVERIDRDMAEALYLGIAHDTGVFQYSNTSPSTMRLAAELMEKGIDHTRILEDTFYSKTYLQQQILGRALMEAVTLMNGQVVFSAIRRREMAFYGVTGRDLEGIVSALRRIEGVHAAIFLYETKPQIFKVSLRSDEKVDVSAIASAYGGGGHLRAAGCMMQGSVHDVINNLTKLIEEQLEG